MISLYFFKKLGLTDQLFLTIFTSSTHRILGGPYKALSDQSDFFKVLRNVGLSTLFLKYTILRDFFFKLLLQGFSM